MCQPRDEGGRRCPDYKRLRETTPSDLAPDPRDDVPDVTWQKEDLSKVWGNDADGRADACAALLTLERAKISEPEMTETIMHVAHQAGGECAYLQSRVKSPESLARKIRTDREEYAARGVKLAPHAAAASMNDVVRYTIVRQDHNGLTEATASTVAQLQSQGWTVKKIKSSYAEGATYKGLHIICESPSGQAAEVQVHSAQSLTAKEAAHKHYEIYRDRSRPPREKRRAKEECQRIFAEVSTPPGLDAVGAMGRKDLIRVPVEKPAVSKS